MRTAKRDDQPHQDRPRSLPSILHLPSSILVFPIPLPPVTPVPNYQTNPTDVPKSPRMSQIPQRDSQPDPRRHYHTNLTACPGYAPRLTTTASHPNLIDKPTTLG